MNQNVIMTIIVLIGAFAIIRTLVDIKKNKITLLLNLIFGGSLFVLLNLMGFQTNLNILTGSLITLYGVPGVALIVVLKLIFKMI